MSDWDDVFGTGTSAESMIGGISAPSREEIREQKEIAAHQARMAEKSKALGEGAYYWSDNEIGFRGPEAALQWITKNLDLQFEYRVHWDGRSSVLLLPPPAEPPYDDADLPF